jgi:ArsR family transcriptional regulator, arsenate/arsenite/antimonite-responsive transcriptional repressor
MIVAYNRINVYMQVQGAMTGTANIFKALGDETRLKILSLLLRKGELCVCRFEQHLGIGQSKASRHLRYLANCGLVQARRDAVWMHYRIHDRPGKAQRKILTSLKSILSG